MNENSECEKSSSSLNNLQCDSRDPGYLISPGATSFGGTKNNLPSNLDSVNVLDSVIPPSNVDSDISKPSCAESVNNIILYSNSESANDIISSSNRNSENVCNVVRSSVLESTKDVISLRNSGSGNETSSLNKNSDCASDAILLPSVKNTSDILSYNSESEHGISLPHNAESTNNINLSCNSESSCDTFQPCTDKLISANDVLPCTMESISSILPDIVQCNSDTNIDDPNLKNDEQIISNAPDSGMKQVDKLTIKCEPEVECKLVGVIKEECIETAILATVSSDFTEYSSDVATSLDELQVQLSQSTFKCEKCDLSFDTRIQFETHQQNTHGDGAGGGKDAPIAAVVKDATVDDRSRGPVRRSFNVFKVEPLNDSPVKLSTSDDAKKCVRSVSRELNNLNTTLVEPIDRRPDYQSSHLRNLKKYRAAKEFGILKSLRDTGAVNKRGIKFQRAAMIGKISSEVKGLIWCRKCTKRFPTYYALKKHTCSTLTRTVKDNRSSNMREEKRARNISVEKKDSNVKYTLDKQMRYRYQCDICLLRVDRHSRLVRHKISMHGPKPYVCNMTEACNAAFSEAVKRDRHIRRKHSAGEISATDEMKNAKGRQSKQPQKELNNVSAVGGIGYEKDKRPIKSPCKEGNENSLVDLNFSGSLGLQIRRPVGRPRKERSESADYDLSIEQPRRPVGRPRKEYNLEQPLKKPPCVCNKCGRSFTLGSGLWLHQKRNKFCRAFAPVKSSSIIKQEENDMSYQSIIEETFGILKREDADEIPGQESKISINDTQQECAENMPSDSTLTVEGKPSEDDKMCLRRVRKKPQESEFIEWPKIYDRRYSPGRLLSVGRSRNSIDSPYMPDRYDHLERPHECDLCGTRFVQLGSMYRHRREIHGIVYRTVTLKDSDGNRIFKCGKCGAEFYNKKELFKHRVQGATCQIAIPLDQRPIRRYNVQKMHPCKKCGRKFFRPIVLYRHLSIDGNCSIPKRVKRTTKTKDDASSTVVKSEIETPTEIPQIDATDDCLPEQSGAQNTQEFISCKKCGRQFTRLNALLLHQKQSKKCLNLTRVKRRRALVANDLSTIVKTEIESPANQVPVQEKKNPEKLLPCNRCGKLFSRPNALFLHQHKSKKCLSLSLIDYKKKSKKFMSSSPVALQQKIKKRTNSSSSTQDNEKKSKKRRMSSPVAPAEESIDESAQEEMDNENERQFKCNRCGKTFVFGSSLSRHRRTNEPCQMFHLANQTTLAGVDSQEVSEKCNKCGRVVPASLMSKHRKSSVCKIMSLSRSAPKAQKILTTVSETPKHSVKKSPKVSKNVAEPVCVIECEVCAVEFSSIQLFRKHECSSQNPTKLILPPPVSPVKLSPSIVEPKSFACPTCNETFSKPEVLKLHSDAGCTLVKGYACTQCPMTFVQFSSLRAHLLLHTDDTVVVAAQKQARNGSAARGGEVHKGDAVFLKDYAQLVRSVEESISACTSGGNSYVSPKKKNLNKSSTEKKGKTR